jgi:hypothetical protein
MVDKTRFGARVRDDTLARLDEEADRRGLDRSKTIDRVVDEWEAAQETDDDDDPPPLAAAGDALALVGSLSWGASIFALAPFLLLTPPASLVGALVVLMLTGYGGSVLVALGAAAWMASADEGATLSAVARDRIGKWRGVAA